MSSSIYLLLFITAVILSFVIVFITRYKKNVHTILYSEGVCNENDGRYDLALHKYEDALNEIRKQKINDELGEKITERIKILRATIDYEKNFQTGNGA
jgi:intein/homing endonuclease